MKKILTIMTAAAVLLAGLIFTGCGAKEIIKETINDSYNSWYKYNTNKQIDVPLIASSTTEGDDDPESPNKLRNAEIYVKFNPDSGLTVAIQSVTSQEVSLLGGSYTTNMDVVVGDTKDFPLTQFDKKKWYALWGSGKFEKTSAPKIITNSGECLLLGSEKAPNSKIQWKKFIANYLLNKLLDD